MPVSPDKAQLMIFLKRTKSGKYAKIEPYYSDYLRMPYLREEVYSDKQYYYSYRED